MESNIINVGKTLILGLPQNKMATPLDILHFYRLYLRKAGKSVLMKDYLWSTNDGNANWIINEHQGARQGTITNCSYSYSYYYSCKKVYSTTAHSWM